MMGDIFSKEKRSDIMSRIRSKDTIPEQSLLTAIRQTVGKRWRIDRNVQSLPGRPDVVLPSLHLVIFLDGCFYHCCPLHGHSPKSNRRYWVPKLQRNKQRDCLNRRILRSMGYLVVRFWEHELRPSRSRMTEAKLKRVITRAKAVQQDKRLRCSQRGV